MHCHSIQNQMGNNCQANQHVDEEVKKENSQNSIRSFGLIKDEENLDSDDVDELPNNQTNRLGRMETYMKHKHANDIKEIGYKQEPCQHASAAEGDLQSNQNPRRVKGWLFKS